MTRYEELLDRMSLADPETASRMRDRLSARTVPVVEDVLSMIIEETIWGLSQETALGQAFSTGLIELAGDVTPQLLELYRTTVRNAGTRSAAIGRILAIHLVPVLKTGDARLIDRFRSATRAFLKIGAYTLTHPMEVLSKLLESGDIESGAAFLEMMENVLSPEMSYNQCKHLCHVLSRAAASFSPSRRLFQIRALMRVAGTDPDLTDGFLDGLTAGADMLNHQGLNGFVSEGLARFRKDNGAGRRFLSLESQQSRDLVDALQVAVSLTRVQNDLNRYLQARTGGVLSVHPMTGKPGADALNRGEPTVFTCGRHICLPDEISRFESRPKNTALYKCLVRLEACHHEFGTYLFDMEKAVDACRMDQAALPDAPGAGSTNLPSPVENTEAALPDDENAPALSDMTLFCRRFPDPQLAADLMTIYEHGRIRILLKRSYPGIMRQALPFLIGEMRTVSSNPLNWLYRRIALGTADEEAPHGWIPGGASSTSPLDAAVTAFDRRIQESACVEDCAVLTAKTYPMMETYLRTVSRNGGSRLTAPFARDLRPDLALDPLIETRTAALKQQLARRGIRIYKSEIRKLLSTRRDKINPDDLLGLIRSSRKASGNLPDLQSVAGFWNNASFPLNFEATALTDTEPAAWYREWDWRQADYLHHHVRVVDRGVTGTSDGFYERTLARHRELVSQFRYAFEMMKPRGLMRLRNWTEGDEPDYRAMLDFVLDRKAGRIPSDRLYIKRIKQERNVAVLLLVDLSRSTGNALSNNAPDAGATVMDIEKEAMVLFCEALDILGDNFAIAGFSGNSRLSVDYTRIKEFDEPMNKDIRGKISGLSPQRNTRMGAAIRHAAAQFEKISAGVRLMVILGDGFPNDVDYKREYALADTRKAITEALGRRIHSHAITVNMQNDSRLDDLYGSVHHTVISDVRELPARLLRIYSSLTRNRSDN